MIFWLLVGVVLGYFFKPQIDKLVTKAVRAIRSNAERTRYETRVQRDRDDETGRHY